MRRERDAEGALIVSFDDDEEEEIVGEEEEEIVGEEEREEIGDAGAVVTLPEVSSEEGNGEDEETRNLFWRLRPPFCCEFLLLRSILELSLPVLSLSLSSLSPSASSSDFVLLPRNFPLSHRVFRGFHLNAKSSSPLRGKLRRSEFRRAKEEDWGDDPFLPFFLLCRR